MSPIGLVIPLAVYALVTLLHLAIPVGWTDGYVVDPATKRPYRYRLNGLVVYGLTVATWAALCSTGLVPWDLLWRHRWESLAGACVLGLAFTFALVLPAPRTGKSFLAELYLGRLENPQLFGGRVDAKMWLYLVGATMLGLNLYSFAITHRMAFGDAASPGVVLYTALFSFFLCEYLFFERVHLYTYDFVAERVGFKLGWGCLLFYPYFYAVGLWSVVERPSPERPTAWLVGAAVIFFVGWSLARGANMQKYAFKRDPSARFLGITPEVVTDGEKRVLVNGFWGVSRHVNYLGEILMATGLTLALGHPGVWTTWLYPLYYVALLVPRQLADDRRCAEKYGPLWQQYVAKVRWRIIPGIY
ncbi:DUF1295 domain-containing protein [Myxococcota bacterium]|nr:DUF1295 domain-containing protein [Myxococcota bacterium]